MVRRAIVLAAGLTLIGACASTPNDSARTPSGGATAPDFTVDQVDGTTFRLSDHFGKDVVVLDFWTTFCQPCIGSLNHLDETYKKKKADGLVVLAVSMDPPETAAQVVPSVRSHGWSFPVAHDAQSKVTDLYNKKSTMPFQVLIGRDGRILKQRESYEPGDEVAVEADINEALRASAK